MSYCTLNENVRGNCPTCEKELDALLAVAAAARQFFSQPYDNGRHETRLRDAVRALDGALEPSSDPPETK